MHMTVVKFTRSHESYVAGDVTRRNAEMAQELVDIGCAEVVASDAATPAPDASEPAPAKTNQKGQNK